MKIKLNRDYIRMIHSRVVAINLYAEMGRELLYMRNAMITIPSQMMDVRINVN